MSRSRFILFAGDDAWRVGMSDDADARLIDPPIAPDAVAALEALNQQGYTGDAIVLALPSAWCLSAPISTINLPRRDRRDAMIFRLEDQLPISAEEFSAGFIETSSDSALGICVQQSRLVEMIRSLEECGIAVRSIVPAALLPVQDLLTNQAEAPDVVTTADGDFFTLLDGKLRSWEFVLPASIQNHVQLETMRRGGDIRVVRLGETSTPRATASVDPGEESTDLRSIRCAAAILNGTVQPWIDLRWNGQTISGSLRLLRGPLVAASAAMILLSLSFSAASLWRASGYSRAAHDDQQELQRIYDSVQPGQPMPDGIKSRLISDERRLRGLTGEGIDAPRQVSVLPELYRLLAHLPADVRWRVQDIRLEDGRLELQGEARSHSDADAIAVALRTTGEFDVEPPRTEQLPDGGVAMTLTGTLTGTLAASGGTR